MEEHIQSPDSENSTLGWTPPDLSSLSNEIQAASSTQVRTSSQALQNSELSKKLNPTAPVTAAKSHPRPHLVGSSSQSVTQISLVPEMQSPTDLDVMKLIDWMREAVSEMSEHQNLTLERILLSLEQAEAHQEWAHKQTNALLEIGQERAKASLEKAERYQEAVQKQVETSLEIVQKNIKASIEAFSEQRTQGARAMDMMLSSLEKRVGEMEKSFTKHLDALEKANAIAIRQSKEVQASALTLVKSMNGALHKLSLKIQAGPVLAFLMIIAVIFVWGSLRPSAFLNEAQLQALLLGQQTLYDYRTADPDRQAAMREILQWRELNWDE